MVKNITELHKLSKTEFVLLYTKQLKNKEQLIKNYYAEQKFKRDKQIKKNKKRITINTSQN